MQFLKKIVSMEIKDENNYQLEIENTNEKTYFSVIISVNYL